MCILWHVSIALIAFALLFPDLISATSIKADPDTVWPFIVPSTRLKYYPCYEGYECARLMVPLDWSAPKNHLDDKIATIAVIKLPAVVPPNHAHYGGTIITNPGGPGSSGVVDLKRWGRLVRKEFDSADKHFDLVSFDPRGVLFTIPNAFCFEDPMARSSWDIQATSIGNLDSSEQAKTMLWARSKALGSLCESANNRSGKNVFKHMTTAVVARDMLALVEEIEHHRKLSTQGGLLPQSEKQALLHAGADADSTPPNLMFWGFSGGTIIGATFASMFPHRIGRMVLDGVVNADDYISNSWTTTFEDTEAVMQSFYQTCFNARAGCALFHPHGPQAIEREVKAILEQVEKQPVAALRETTSFTPEIVTYSDVKRFIFWSLFSPLHTFPSLAQGLADIRKGNATVILERTHTPLQCSDRNSPPDVDNDIYPGFLNEVLPAISCSDGDDMSGQSFEDFKNYLADLERRSPTIGAIWAQHNRLACTGWKIRPSWRFIGPFGGNTSAPILFVGNTRDPVTPAASAKYMAAKFPGSGLLIQDCDGHGYNAAPSACREAAVRKYFARGEVSGTVTSCAADRKPFQEQSDEYEVRGYYYRDFMGWK